jgi:hypothetical protein
MRGVRVLASILACMAAVRGMPRRFWRPVSRTSRRCHAFHAVRHRFSRVLRSIRSLSGRVTDMRWNKLSTAVVATLDNPLSNAFERGL